MDLRRYIPIYAILNSMENLRFDKKGYFHVLVFYGLFYKRNRKHVFSLVFPAYVIETLVEVWENPKYRGNTSPVGSCPHFNLSFSQTSTRAGCFYNCMETRNIFSTS